MTLKKARKNLPNYRVRVFHDILNNIACKKKYFFKILLVNKLWTLTFWPHRPEPKVPLWQQTCLLWQCTGFQLKQSEYKVHYDGSGDTGQAMQWSEDAIRFDTWIGRKKSKDIKSCGKGRGILNSLPVLIPPEFSSWAPVPESDRALWTETLPGSAALLEFETQELFEIISRDYKMILNYLPPWYSALLFACLLWSYDVKKSLFGVFVLYYYWEPFQRAWHHWPVLPKLLFLLPGSDIISHWVYCGWEGTSH